MGAPYTIHFGDLFEPRALLLTYGPRPRVQSIPLYGTQKRVLRTGIDGWWEGKSNKGDIVRVQIELRREEYPRWSELYERSQKACAKRGLIVDSIVPLLISDSEQDNAMPKPRSAPRNDTQEFNLYCERNKIDKSTRKVGEELL